MPNTLFLPQGLVHRKNLIATVGLWVSGSNMRPWRWWLIGQTLNSLTVMRYAIVRRQVTMGSVICMATAPAIGSSFESSPFRAIELFFFCFFFIVETTPVSHIVNDHKHAFNYHKHIPYSFTQVIMAPAHATRSKKSTKQTAPKSKVTKRPSKSAPRTTKTKTPPPREEILVSTTSSGTITPDEVEETPPPSARVDLDELIAQLSKVQNRRDRHHSHKKCHKSRSRRHHRRHRHRHRYSDTSDTSD